MSLAHALYHGGGVWVGSGGDSLAQMTGPDMSLATSEWAAQGGGAQQANSVRPVTVDNRLGSQPILAKAERCVDDFFIVSAGQVSRDPIDGVKPAAWLTPGAEPFSQDWYKVASPAGRLGVRTQPDGTAETFAPTRRALALLAIPECDFDGLCRRVPGDVLYHELGGRKQEPQWSQDAAPWHWDWRYPSPPNRRARCGP